MLATKTKKKRKKNQEEKSKTLETEWLKLPVNAVVEK